MGADYIMKTKSYKPILEAGKKKPNNKHFIITFNKGEVSIKAVNVHDAKPVITIHRETGETFHILPEQVVASVLENNVLRDYNYDFLGYQIRRRGDECRFILGNGQVVEKFLWVNLTKNTVTVEEASDEYNTYFVEDGILYRDCSAPLYLSPFDEGNVNVGIPSEWIEDTQAWWFRLKTAKRYALY